MALTVSMNTSKRVASRTKPNATTPPASVVAVANHPKARNHSVPHTPVPQIHKSFLQHSYDEYDTPFAASNEADKSPEVIEPKPMEKYIEPAEKAEATVGSPYIVVTNDDKHAANFPIPQKIFKTFDEYWVYRYTQRFRMEFSKGGFNASDAIISYQMDLVDAYLDSLFCSIGKSNHKSALSLPPAHISLSGLSNYVEYFCGDSTVKAERKAVKTRIKASPLLHATCAPPLEMLDIPSLTDSGATYHVAIIGAGASGLMAGNILKRLGFSVCILEARNYPGGRIATVDMERMGDEEQIANALCATTPVDLGANWLMYDVSFPQYPWRWAHQRKIESSNILGSVWEPICTALWFDDNGRLIDNARIQLLYDIALVANGRLNDWVIESTKINEMKAVHHKRPNIDQADNKAGEGSNGKDSSTDDCCWNAKDRTKMSAENTADKVKSEGSNCNEGMGPKTMEKQPECEDSLQPSRPRKRKRNESLTDFAGPFESYEVGVTAAIEWVIENQKTLKIPNLGKPFDDIDRKIMMKMVQRIYGCVSKLSEIPLAADENVTGERNWKASRKYFERLGARRQAKIKSFHKFNKPGITPHVFDYKNISGDRLCNRGYGWLPEEIIRQGNLENCIFYGSSVIGVTLVENEKASTESCNLEDEPKDGTLQRSSANFPFKQSLETNDAKDDVVIKSKSKTGQKMEDAKEPHGTDVENGALSSAVAAGKTENFAVNTEKTEKIQIKPRRHKIIFEPSEAFKGPKTNYVYKRGRYGVGYYKDHKIPATTTTSAEEERHAEKLPKSVNKYSRCVLEVSNPEDEAIHGRKKLTALRVIVTVPIGVLQGEALCITPPLSDEVCEAINGWGRGCHNKVLLRFSSVFWEPHAGFFNTTHPMFQFMNLHAFGIANALCAHSFGYYNWDSLSDDEVVQECTSLLYSIFPIDKMKEMPVLLYKKVTRWDTDRASMCSYGYQSKNSIEKSQKLLAQPFPWYPDYKLDDSSSSSLKHCIGFFAGEHTSDSGQQCVHGAVHSGVRAAAECASSLLNATIPPWLDDEFYDKYNDTPTASYHVGESSAQHQWKSVWWTNHSSVTVNSENYKATHPRDVYCRRSSVP